MDAAPSESCEAAGVLAGGSAVLTDKEMHERLMMIPTAMSSRHSLRSECLPLRSDNTIQEVRWKNAENLSTLAGRPVRFRFHLRDGSLSLFWVSPDRSGASHGYVAAGGPGFSGPVPPCCV